MLGLRDWHIVRRHFDDVPLERVQVGPLLFGADQPAPEHYRLGDRVFGLSRAPVVADSNGAGAFGEVIVLHDISTESAVDEAKNNFIATISHELRTPLTPICGNSELLLRGTFGELNPDQREMLENVRTRAEQLRDLVNNIVLIASLQANTLQIELEPQDVWITVEHVVAPLRRLFKRKGLELVINLPEGLPSVVADREHLRLVLTQLLDNARRYTQTGGVTVTAARYDSMVQIDITDTGPGIPQEEFPRLFTRFHRVAGNNSPERGSGLGLAITRQLVERQGGRVWAHSALGQGSTFSLALPIADEHDDAIVGRENADATA
jgi:signal transduction histidine kinase